MTDDTAGQWAPRRRRVKANGIDFGYFDLGSGPLALCLHGFPDTAYTWRHLLPRLADAGFRAVAPFMRGYAPTSCAADGSYHLGALVADAIALHEALGGDEQGVLIGHDWGAEAAYGAAAFAPARWSTLVTIAVPPLALDERIFSDYDQLKRLFYLFFMKTPRAESVIAANNMAFLDRLWRDWSPGYDPSEDLDQVKRSLDDPRNLSAAISYYRADERALEGDAMGPYVSELEALEQTPPQRTLYLHGRSDGCIDVSIAADAENHLAPGSTMAVIDDAGHFPHLEQPKAVNELVLGWLSRI